MDSATFDFAHRTYDDQGNICQLNHVDNPFRHPSETATTSTSTAEGMATPVTAKTIADAYLREAVSTLGLSETMLTGTTATVGEDMDSSPEKLEFDSEKSVMGNSRVSYNQVLHGTPVWESGIVVQVEESPMQVIGSQCTVKRQLNVTTTRMSSSFVESKIDQDTTRSLLNLSQRDTVRVFAAKKFVYRYNAAKRLEIHHAGPISEALAKLPFALPPVASDIEAFGDYLVTAVEFTIFPKQTGESSWLALIEQRTGSILMLRSLRGCDREPVIQESHLQMDLPRGIQRSTNALDSSAVASPKVVFFDIGDTLGKPVVAAGQLLRIDLFPSALEVVKELSEKGFPVGLISDPGPFSANLIKSLLQDTGIMTFLDANLLIFGVKNNKQIFDDAASLAGVNPNECLFVGENSQERSFAEESGYSTVGSPDQAVSVVDPSAVLAWVYLRDPKTKIGAAGPSPSSNPNELDRFRDLVSLVGLKPAPVGAKRSLEGEYVRIVDISAPSPTIPTSPLPGDFRFSVATNDFGAVNAYYNCDRLFRILEGFGIDVKSYFDGTTFPVRVDHRVGFPSPNSVNASAPGFSMPPRSDGFRFALAALNTSVCMATDWRVVLHEFGHALLWDNVGSPNFKFAHSAGDAMAAILNDPGNRSTRNVTFPWVQIGRSHQRPVGSLAWYGPSYEPFFGNDGAGYVAEQMLSSTLFRIYQSVGGDSADKKQQEFAAAYVVFLIIKSIGLMTTSNNPERPEGYADLLMQADTGMFKYLGSDTTIGSIRKVIRWAFEMQGAYRTPPGIGQSPTNQIGNPPKVDVFINDGRDGNYQFSNLRESTDIWNRQSADSGTVHQDPVLGQFNFAYVRVSNRGLSQAINVSVNAFQSTAIENAMWPDDWNALLDGTVTSPGNIIPGGSIVVGPLKWLPMSTQPTLLMACAASGDATNLSRFTSANPIDSSRLIPFDNNLAIRRMVTVNHAFGG